MARTLKEIQTRLNRSPAVSPKLIVDGEKGPATTAAVVAYQKANGLKETGLVDQGTLDKLFPEDAGGPANSHTIQATITDWFLNYAQSKIVWAAAALIALAVGWINTRFGIDVSPEIQNAVTSLLVAAGGSLIAILRGWGKDTPRVAAKAPAVIEKPTEYVGQKP